MWITLGVAFGVAIIVLLVYGIATHKSRKAKEEAEAERGFLKDLVMHQDWPPISLIVAVELSEVESRIMGAVKKAAKWWEKETGKRYFIPPGELVDGGHVVSIMLASLNTAHDPNHAYAYVHPWISISGYMTSASVRMMPGWEDASEEFLVNALKHEFGHLLGLAHDEYPTSVMFEVVSARLGFVSDHDKELLRRTYNV
jgi:hypothetical protein